MTLFSGEYILENNGIESYITPHELDKDAAKRTEVKKREALRLNDLGSFLLIILFVVYTAVEIYNRPGNHPIPPAFRMSDGAAQKQGENWTISSVSPTGVHETGGMSR